MRCPATSQEAGKGRRGIQTASKRLIPRCKRPRTDPPGREREGRVKTNCAQSPVPGAGVQGRRPGPTPASWAWTPPPLPGGWPWGERRTVILPGLLSNERSQTSEGPFWLPGNPTVWSVPSPGPRCDNFTAPSSELLHRLPLPHHQLAPMSLRRQM